MTGWKGVNNLIAKTAWVRDFCCGSVDDVEGSVFTKAVPILMQPLHQQ